jgi:hypothetical protein
MSNVKIETSFVYPPIPTRKFDWQATTENYDAELVDGEWVSSHPIGHGATEQEAIDDLKQQLEERE